MKIQKLITEKGVIIRGFKATDENMKCRGFKYEIGKWYEHDGDLEMCKSGFHFCEYPSGPWSFYNDKKDRMFEVEAEFCIIESGPGAEIKHVAKKICLVKEITIFWDDNTGGRNPGSWNTGGMNTGDGNAGDRNTGDGNAGDGNTGDGNAGDGHSGSLCHGEAPFFLFNKTAQRKDVNFSLVRKLSEMLVNDIEIDPTPYLCLPNATPESIKELHEAHIKARLELLK